MRYDRILFLVAGLFFILFSCIIRFLIIPIIKKSDKRSNENKKKEERRGILISIFLFLMAIYWIVLFIFYNNLF